MDNRIDMVNISHVGISEYFYVEHGTFYFPYFYFSQRSLAWPLVLLGDIMGNWVVEVYSTI